MIALCAEKTTPGELIKNEVHKCMQMRAHYTYSQFRIEIEIERESKRDREIERENIFLPKPKRICR